MNIDMETGTVFIEKDDRLYKVTNVKQVFDALDQDGLFYLFIFLNRNISFPFLTFPFLYIKRFKIVNFLILKIFGI